MKNEDYADIISDYSAIGKFVAEYPELSLIHYDYYIANKVSLFTVHENFDFEALEEMIARISDALPGIKRIFIKPIIQLTENSEIVPIEACRLVNNDTLQHIARHAELWDDVDETGIKPLKLLTRNYLDNFSIYENVVFAKCINTILNYLRRNMRELKTLMYNSKNLEFNLLERRNHLNYFLALGKLHTGYVRNFDKYFDDSQKLYPKMELMYDQIHSRLRYNVYRKNKKLAQNNIQLHSTNILAMQRDYHKVYLLLKYFDKIMPKQIEVNSKQRLALQSDYYNYCQIMTIFAAMHFDFVGDDSVKIVFKKTNITLHNAEWNLTIQRSKFEDYDTIELIMQKHKTYKITMIPMTLNIDDYFDNPDADETIYLSPIEHPDMLFVSISDVESFRRIQQVIFRAMIYTANDLEKDCPFCYGAMHYDEDDKAYYCDRCNTIVSEKTCPTYNVNYFATSIYRLNIDDSKSMFSFDKSDIFYFRNITQMTSDGDVICPICKKVH